MLKRYFAAAAVAAFLAGCSSNPAVTGNGEGANGANQNAVAPVQANTGAAEGQGPAGVSKVIYFAFDSYAIEPQYQSVITGQANYLRANPNAHVTLEGNTDPRGSREYNLALGQRRADAVKRALELVGVSDNQLEAVSFGKENLASPGHTEADYAQDRRVEFHYR